MQSFCRLVSLLGLALCVTAQAQAYNGPGLGLAAIAVVLGIIGSVFLWLFGALWYPIKRKLKQNNKHVHSDLDEQPESDSAPTET